MRTARSSTSGSSTCTPNGMPCGSAQKRSSAAAASDRTRPKRAWFKRAASRPRKIMERSSLPEQLTIEGDGGVADGRPRELALDDRAAGESEPRETGRIRERAAD